MKKSNEITIESQPVNAAHAEILEWVKNVSFKRSLFGGLDEVDVWKKFRELNSLYEKLLVIQNNVSGKDEK